MVWALDESSLDEHFRNPTAMWEPVGRGEDVDVDSEVAQALQLRQIAVSSIDAKLLEDFDKQILTYIVAECSR